jgi:hypothetical protein
MNLTTNQIDSLARLTNYHTRYEVVATNMHRTILAGYTSRKSRSGLLATVRMHSEAWVELTGDNALSWGRRASDGAAIGEWVIRFSGRTQREAIIEGELPFIAEAVR